MQFDKPEYGDEALKEVAMEVLESIASCFWLESEKELNIATGLRTRMDCPCGRSSK